MMRLTETAQGLSIAYPGWLGLLIFALGIALAVWILRNFQFNGKFFGYCMAALLALFGGIYFFTFKAELTPEFGRSYALFRGGDTRVDWRHASNATLQERPGKGRPMYIVVDTAGGMPFEINASDLSDSHRAQALAYIRSRIEQTAKP